MGKLPTTFNEVIGINQRRIRNGKLQLQREKVEIHEELKGGPFKPVPASMELVRAYEAEPY